MMAKIKKVAKRSLVLVFLIKKIRSVVALGKLVLWYCLWTFPKAVYYAVKVKKLAKIRFKGKLLFWLPNHAIGPMILFGAYLIQYSRIWNINSADIVCISGEKQCNKYVERLFSQKFLVIHDQKLHDMMANGGHFFLDKDEVIPYIVPHDIYNGMPFCENTVFDFAFSEEENVRGNALLEKIGVPQNSKFVCISNRDQSYWKAQANKEQPWDSYRDTRFADLKPTIEWLREQNFQVVRMGYHDISETADLCLSVMVLGDDDRSFADMWLHAKCEFALYGGSGIGFLPWLFGRRCLQHNAIPLKENVLLDNTLILPKTFVDTKSNRRLPAWDILHRRCWMLGTAFGRIRVFAVTADAFQDQTYYDQAGIAVVDCSPEQLLEATKECVNGLDVELPTSAQQEKIKRKFPLRHPVRHMRGAFSGVWLKIS